ncbi:hypothetical protein V6N13_094094 [Hibiscus sabdariffa]|uniref:Uncharacterized protein n=1 Tax=Hibiscus sabdariffa TaxID=183260 RepID=A0ABR2BKS2_9ROSI
MLYFFGCLEQQSFRRYQRPNLGHAITRDIELGRKQVFRQVASLIEHPKDQVLGPVENAFSGTIPPRIGTLPELMQLSLSENKLTGEIPKALSSCKKLGKWNHWFK